MLTVQHVDELGVPAARHPLDPFLGDVRADDGVLPAGLLLIGGELLQVPAGWPSPPGGAPPPPPPASRPAPPGPGLPRRVWRAHLLNPLTNLTPLPPSGF